MKVLLLIGIAVILSSLVLGAPVAKSAAEVPAAEYEAEDVVVAEGEEVPIEVPVEVPAVPAAAKEAAKTTDNEKEVEELKKEIESLEKTRTSTATKVGCYSAVVSNILTFAFILIIAAIWYFACCRHGRCCCLCCYNAEGRCCCGCASCDGYLRKEDEEMVIERGEKDADYNSIEKEQ